MMIPRTTLALLTAIIVALGVYWWRQNPSAVPPSSNPPLVRENTKPPAANATPPPGSLSSTPANDATSTAGAATRDRATPAQILARLAALKVSANQPRSIRELLVELEALRQLGPAALPALRAFLANGQDADYDAAVGKVTLRDGKVPADFVVPPSLRLALLEVAKNIGGAAAEELLARELMATGRGVEAGYIASALEQIAPGKYRALATAAARDLLAMPLSGASKSLLDRSDREYLYQMLTAAGDRTHVATAQTQLLLPNGQIDPGALRYLQQALGEDAVAVAIRAWDDPRIPATQKEPLARLALNYVGTSDRADQFYQSAIADPNLSPEARKNLIEDLNQAGFVNVKKLTPADVALVDRRIALIDRLAPGGARDPMMSAAFAEARKDLVAMREKSRPSAAAPKP